MLCAAKENSEISFLRIEMFGAINKYKQADWRTASRCCKR